jgi:hypothetical protein
MCRAKPHKRPLAAMLASAATTDRSAMGLGLLGCRSRVRSLRDATSVPLRGGLARRPFRFHRADASESAERRASAVIFCRALGQRPRGCCRCSARFYV